MKSAATDEFRNLEKYFISKYLYIYINKINPLILFIYFLSFLAMQCNMWNLSSSTRDQARVPCIAMWILNH